MKKICWCKTFVQCDLVSVSLSYTKNALVNCWIAWSEVRWAYNCHCHPDTVESITAVATISSKPEHKQWAHTMFRKTRWHSLSCWVKQSNGMSTVYKKKMQKKWCSSISIFSWHTKNHCYGIGQIGPIKILTQVLNDNRLCSNFFTFTFV